MPMALRERVRQGAGQIGFAGQTALIPLVPTPIPGSEGPYVRVMINNTGPYTFVFDTGATITIIDEAVTRAAHAPVVFHRDKRSVVMLGDMNFGNVHLLRTYVLQDRGIKSGVGADGVLGFDAFGTFPFTLTNSQIAVHRSFRPANDAMRLQFLPDNSGWHFQAVPLITLRSGATTISTLIDSGDDGWIDFLPSDFKKLRILKPPVSAGGSYNPNTGMTQTTIAQVDGDLNAGEYTLRNPILRIDPSLPVSDIGWPLLTHMMPITFDRLNRRVYFTRRAVRDIVTPPLRTLGFSLNFTRDGVSVRSQLPDVSGTPKVGDAIVSIDGKPANRFNGASYAQLLPRRRAVKIAWRHSDKSYTRTFSVLVRP